MPVVQVDDDLAVEMDHWADLLEGVWRSWASVGRQGGQGPVPGSPAHGENAAFLHHHPDCTEHEAFLAGLQAAQFIDAAGQHVLGLAALYEARKVVLPSWPVVRAVFEHLGRASWILAPAITADQRVARCWLERLFGAYQHKLTLSGIGASRSEVRRAREIRDHVREEIERRFPGSQTEMPTTPGDYPDWNVGGEPLLGLGPSVTNFAKEQLDPNLKRIYDALSFVSHPAPIELAAIAPPVEINGRVEFSYRARSDTVVKLASLAAAALYRGAWLYCTYCGFSGTALETWADEVAERYPGLFKSSEV